MKIKDGFVLRKVAGKYAVVATGEASKSFHGMVKLSENAKNIWTGISQGKSVDEIIEELVSENSEDDRAAITSDVQSMVEEMKTSGFIVD